MHLCVKLSEPTAGLALITPTTRMALSCFHTFGLGPSGLTALAMSVWATAELVLSVPTSGLGLFGLPLGWVLAGSAGTNSWLGLLGLQQDCVCLNMQLN
jgi:hypothetical protein